MIGLNYSSKEKGFINLCHIIFEFISIQISINKLNYTDMAEIVTLEKFNDFEDRIFKELKELKQSTTSDNRWLKSGDVKEMLGISHGKLQDMRDRGMIPFTKLGGVIFYDRIEIEKLLLKGINKQKA